MENEYAYIVVQEGGTSTELYVITFDTEEDANEYREECSRDGGYSTTPPVRVPKGLEQYLNEIQEVVRSLSDLETVEVEDEGEETKKICECGRSENECTYGKDGSREHHNL